VHISDFPAHVLQEEVLMKSLTATVSMLLVLSAVLPLSLFSAERMVIGEMLTNTG
jgi:hypothetical protein